MYLFDRAIPSLAACREASVEAVIAFVTVFVGLTGTNSNESAADVALD
jgi:hypothetical protein